MIPSATVRTWLPCLLQGGVLPFAAMPTTISQQVAHWLQRETASGPTDRPWVTLCYAQSWDGSLALRPGHPLVLSNRDSLQLTHRLRSLHDGILVGIGTVLADDPQLTVRECSGPSPQPVVLDSQLRMPVSARLCQGGNHRCWVLTSAANAGQPREDVELIAVDTEENGHLNLHDALVRLADRGIRHVMVEGGAQVINGFLRAGLADGIVLTVAPALVGGYKAVPDLGLNAEQQIPRISPIHTERLGDDLIMWGRLRYARSAEDGLS